MISIVINNTTPANEKQKIKYRSFKNLDVMALNEDMSKVNIQVQSNTSTNEIDVNEIYVTLESDMHTILINMFQQKKCIGKIISCHT
jgi:uncharacterized protein YaeQ